MTPNRTPQHITAAACDECRKGFQWWTRTIMGMISLVLMLVGWSMWWSYTASVSAAEIKGEQSVQSKDNEWIKDSLKRIEKRMDSLHLPGGE